MFLSINLKNQPLFEQLMQQSPLLSIKKAFRAKITLKALL